MSASDWLAMAGILLTVGGTSGWWVVSRITDQETRLRLLEEKAKLLDGGLSETRRTLAEVRDLVLGMKAVLERVFDLESRREHHGRRHDDPPQVDSR